MTEILVFKRDQWPAALPERWCRRWQAADNSLAGTWRERSLVEEDEEWLQLIPYLLLHDQHGRIWSYRRKGGDSRLAGSRSCGVGGHVERIDAGEGLEETARKTAIREAVEELGCQPEQLGPLKVTGWIHERESAIGRVHIGLVLESVWRAREEPQPPAGEALIATGFIEPQLLIEEPLFETWSRMAVELAIGCLSDHSADGGGS